MTFVNPSDGSLSLVAGYFRVQVQLDWTGLGEPAHQACVQTELEARGLAFLRSLVAAVPSRRSRPSVRTRRSLRPRRREAVAR